MITTGLPKAEYAIGYFTEMGIGCRRDPLEANVWYVKAAEKGEQRAIERLKRIADAAEGGSITGKGGRKLDLKNLGGSNAGKGVGKRISSRELKRKTEELKVMNGAGGGLPKRSSSLPQGAMELQLPLSPSSGNVGGERLVKTPGTPGKDKECAVM